MNLHIFSKVGAFVAVLGLVGYTVIFPSFIAISGEDFAEQLSVDANGIENFDAYESGDKVTIIDTISRMQFENSKTSIWVESIGKSDNDVRFIFSNNLMNEFGIGNRVVITFEVSSNGQSEIVNNEEMSTRPSTIFDYLFILLSFAGIGLTVFGFIKIRQQPQASITDDWGADSFAAASPSPAAVPPTMPPTPVPPQAQNPPTMGAVPEAAPTFPSPSPSQMTITVPPGVVSGQVLTVTMPNGQVVNVQVPPGCTPGSQFTISVTQ